MKQSIFNYPQGHKNQKTQFDSALVGPWFSQVTSSLIPGPASNQRFCSHPVLLWNFQLLIPTVHLVVVCGSSAMLGHLQTGTNSPNSLWVLGGPWCPQTCLFFHSLAVLGESQSYSVCSFWGTQLSFRYRSSVDLPKANPDCFSTQVRQIPLD